MASTSVQQPPKALPTGPWPSAALDAASHGAIAFVQIYYEAYDEPTRRAGEIPKLYLPTAKVLWNGNSVEADESKLRAFLESMPLSRHDVQTIDCHPVEAPTSASGPAPDLILNVTGSVLHGPTVMQFNDNPQIPARDQPRKFHEMFMLRAAEQGEGMQPKYAIHSSNFRFIG